MAPASTKNLTILLTDVKGFTEKTSHKSRAEILAMLEKHKELVLPVLENGGGRLVKTIGDAFLMAFESPTDAVLAGVAVQDSLRAFNAGKQASERIEVRVAINVGEVTLSDNDVFGDPVNITARIESVAEAGEVYFTEAVYLAMNKTEVPSSEIGLLQLKGIPEKIRVYKVRREVPAGSEGAGLAAAVLRGSAKAMPASRPGGGGRPAARRRAGALLVDFLLCAALFGAVAKQARRASSDWRPRQEAVNVTKDGLDVDVDGVKVTVSGSGVRTSEAGGRRPARGLLFGFFWFAYQFLCLKRWSTTIGGLIFKLRVERADGKPLEESDRLIRSAATLASGYAAFLGYLWALWEKDGRGWHDLLAGTAVVDAARPV